MLLFSFPADSLVFVYFENKPSCPFYFYSFLWTVSTFRLTCFLVSFIYFQLRSCILNVAAVRSPRPRRTTNTWILTQGCIWRKSRRPYTVTWWMNISARDPSSVSVMPGPRGVLSKVKRPPSTSHVSCKFSHLKTSFNPIKIQPKAKRHE